MLLRWVWFHGPIRDLVPFTYTPEETLVPFLCLTCITTSNTTCSSTGRCAATCDAEPSGKYPAADQVSPLHSNGGKTRNLGFKEEEFDGVRTMSQTPTLSQTAPSTLPVLGIATPSCLDDEIAVTPKEGQTSPTAFTCISDENSVGCVEPDSVDCVENHAGSEEFEGDGEGEIQEESSAMFGRRGLLNIPNIQQLFVGGFLFAVRYS